MNFGKKLNSMTVGPNIDEIESNQLKLDTVMQKWTK